MSSIKRDKRQALKGRNVGELYSSRFFDYYTKGRSDALKARIASLLLGSPTDVSYEAFVGHPKPDVQMDVPVYCQHAQLEALFKKDQDLTSPINQEQAALSSFFESEESCQTVNFNLTNGCIPARINGPDASAILHYAREKIASILGDVPALSDLDLSFGPGASTSCRKMTSARYKLSADPSISNSLIANKLLFKELLAELPHIAAADTTWRVQPGKLEFVPKNYKTLRSICLEPTYTSMIQRGVGTLMKQKLKRCGIDLYDQSINRDRARMGSTSEHDYCTIDLERASDSVASQLVAELVPFEWYDLLSSIRSDFIELPDGSITEIHKFSSMGNGYTFELESMIFYALSFGISRHYNLSFDLTVYGDDIVTNKALADRILDLFPVFGFSVNVEKSFLDGPFRESCGFDALHGIDVRPFFWKDRASFALVTNFYNFLHRKPWFDPSGQIREVLINEIPIDCRFFGPDGFGDGHLLTDDDHVPKRSNRLVKNGFGGYHFATIVAKATTSVVPLPFDYILPAYVAATKDSKEQGSYLRRNFTIPPVEWIDECHPLVRDSIKQYNLLFASKRQAASGDPYSVRSKKITGRWINVYVLDR